MVDEKIVKRVLILSIVAVIFILALLVISPIIIPILFGLLFAYIFSPIYNKIYAKIKRKNISAFLLIIGIIVVIAIPIIWLTPMVVKQTVDIYATLQEINLVDPIEKILPSVVKPETARAIAININNLAGKAFTSVLNEFTELVVNIPNLLLQLVVFLFTFFFSVRDSKKLKKYVSELSPFRDSTEEKIMKEFRGITNSIIYGQVLIGVIQGLAVGVGLWVLGVPRALTLTVVAIILAIIPFLGSWLVWLPVSLLLLITGNTFEGVALLLYGALFVASIDNILRPIFIARSSDLPIVMSVLGIIGGLYLFGITGIVLGPLILAYVLIIIEFYKQGKLDELFKN
tara:strand:- start:3447 stop:4475 length:1029 start_codon:yes stop_codon:yes gene_type:complete